MKKLLFCFILFSSACNAQDMSVIPTGKDTFEFHRFFASVNAGLSMPSGDYGTANTIGIPDSTNVYGFANFGYNLHIHAGIFITGKLGALLNASLTHNSLNQEIYNVNATGNTYFHIGGPFNMWQCMAGVFYRFELENDQFICVEGLGGIIFANYPQINFYNGFTSYTKTYESARNALFCISASYEKMLNENIGFLFGASYSYAKISYPTVTYVFSGQGVGTLYFNHTQELPTIMSYGSTEITAGINFHF